MPLKSSSKNILILFQQFEEFMQEICVSVCAAAADRVPGVVKGSKSKGEEREEKTYGLGRKKVQTNIFSLGGRQSSSEWSQRRGTRRRTTKKKRDDDDRRHNSKKALKYFEAGDWVQGEWDRNKNIKKMGVRWRGAKMSLKKVFCSFTPKATFIAKQQGLRQQDQQGHHQQQHKQQSKNERERESHESQLSICSPPTAITFCSLERKELQVLWM